MAIRGVRALSEGAWWARTWTRPRPRCGSRRPWHHDRDAAVGGLLVPGDGRLLEVVGGVKPEVPAPEREGPRVAGGDAGEGLVPRGCAGRLFDLGERGGGGRVEAVKLGVAGARELRALSTERTRIIADGGELHGLQIDFGEPGRSAEERVGEPCHEQGFFGRAGRVRGERHAELLEVALTRRERGARAGCIFRRDLEQGAVRVVHPGRPLAVDGHGVGGSGARRAAELADFGEREGVGLEAVEVVLGRDDVDQLGFVGAAARTAGRGVAAGWDESPIISARIGGGGGYRGVVGLRERGGALRPAARPERGDDREREGKGGDRRRAHPRRVTRSASVAQARCTLPMVAGRFPSSRIGIRDALVLAGCTRFAHDPSREPPSSAFFASRSCFARRRALRSRWRGRPALRKLRSGLDLPGCRDRPMRDGLPRKMRGCVHRRRRVRGRALLPRGQVRGGLFARRARPLPRGRRL